MYCRNCGTNCSEDSSFCPACGVSLLQNGTRNPANVRQGAFNDVYARQNAFGNSSGQNPYTVSYPQQSRYSPVDGQPYENLPSGNNPLILSQLPKWNWGACFLNWIWIGCHAGWGWGIGALLGFFLLNSFTAGIGGLAGMIILGCKGNEIAWRHRRFASLQEFNAVQKAWAAWGIGLFCGSIALSLLMFGGMIAAFLAAVCAE